LTGVSASYIICLGLPLFPCIHSLNTHHTTHAHNRALTVCSSLSPNGCLDSGGKTKDWNQFVCSDCLAHQHFQSPDSKRDHSKALAGCFSERSRDQTDSIEPWEALLLFARILG
jgi:hypothetical protein